MEKLLIFLCVMVGIAAILLAFPEGIIAIAFATLLSFLVVFGLHRFAPDKADSLVKIFLVALLVRLIFGLCVHVFDLRAFFGGDAVTYDQAGNSLVESWSGIPITDPTAISRGSGSGWGMNYLTGSIYFVLGRNIFAAQCLCIVLGAATAPLVYICSYNIFNNRKVGEISAWLIALFPAFIVWSGQLLKDGLIIFLLVVVMIIALKLQERINYGLIIILILAISGIITLRFYIFYMVVLALVGGFIVGQSSSVKSIAQRLVILVIMGLAFTYLGVSRNAGEQFNKYGNLEKIQVSRSDLANSAGSGFGGELDVSTTDGAIAALPIGFVYLMFAPFPWQAGSFRSAITLPEVLTWWAMMPLLVSGIIYALKNRLRKALPVLIFVLMLTLAYSLFQGNVGTAYRQRTQIQVFLFMFIAVGWVIRREKRENKINLRNAREQRFRERLKIGNSIKLKKV